jgi:hypothetical protein
LSPGSTKPCPQAAAEFHQLAEVSSILSLLLLTTVFRRHEILNLNLAQRFINMPSGQEPSHLFSS